MAKKEGSGHYKRQLSANLKTLQSKWGKGNDEMGALFDVPPATWSTYKVGRNFPVVDFYVMLQRLTGMPIIDWLTRDVGRHELLDAPLKQSDGLFASVGEPGEHYQRVGWGEVITRLQAVEGDVQLLKNEVFKSAKLSAK